MRSILASLLLLLVAALLQSCSRFGNSGNPLDDLRQAIRRSVDDPERAAAMLESLERTDQLMLRSAKVLADGATAQRQLFADYDSTPADFDALFENVSNNRRRLQEEMLLEHIRFKNTATAGEWSALADVHSRAVDARAEALARSAIAAARS